MENLERDPIIEFYLSFSHSTVQESSLPIFSETLLRLAARHALGNVRPVEPETLALYRKLILFYYAETYAVVDDLLKIMPCFTEAELISCFENFETIKNEWLTFTKTNLLYFIRKKAFFAIFTEWTRRYVQLYDELDTMRLRSEALKIHTFFKWGTKGINQWLRSFKSNTLKGNWAESDTRRLENVTEKDLQVANIALDIKDQLHPLIYKELQEVLMQPNESSDNESGTETEMSERVFNISPPLEKRLKMEDDYDNEYIEKSDEIGDYIVKAEDTSTEGIQIHEEFTEQCEQEAETEVDENEMVQVVEVFDPESDGIDDSSSIEKGDYGETIEEDTSIINDEKATTYLSALQAYVVVNGLYDAIPLLDHVDSILRAKLEHENEEAP